MKKYLYFATYCSALAAPLSAQTNTEKVTKNIDMDGDFFMVNNIENDLSKLARLGNDLIQTARARAEASGKDSGKKCHIPENLDLQKILKTLGGDKLVAYGRSAKFTGDHWTNKMYWQTGGSNKGLFSFSGEKATPYGVTSFAPAGTDLAIDFQLDYRQAAALTKQLSADVDCPKMKRFSMWTERPLAKGKTLGELTNNLQLQVSVAVKLDDKERQVCPKYEQFTFPKMHFCSRIKGFNPIWEQVGAMAGFVFKVEKQEDGTTLLTPHRLPKHMEGHDPVLLVDEKNSTLWIASSKEFLAECQGNGKKLSQDPQFQAISKGYGEKGNALAYLSRQACLEFRQVAEAKRSLRKHKYLSDDYFKFTLDHLTESKNGYFASMVKTDQGIQFILKSPCPIKDMICGKKGWCKKGCKKGYKGCHKKYKACKSCKCKGCKCSEGKKCDKGCKCSGSKCSKSKKALKACPVH